MEDLPIGVGGPSVFVLLSLVNKETALGLVIGQNLHRQGDKTEFWEEKAESEKERAAMHEAARSDKLNLSW